MAKKAYTFSEVCQHNSSKDCWLLISGKVYDVTKFLDDHPGGDEVLLSATGKDATYDFEDVGHSKNAKNMMEEFYVGDVDLATVPEKQTFVPLKQAAMSHDKSSEFLIKILQVLVPIGILALALSLRLFINTDE